MNKDYHLIKNSEFDNVYKHKQRLNSPFLTIYYYPNEIGHFRFGLSVSKKVGKAHKRVKIRRQLRSIIELLGINDLKYDIVIVVRQSYLETSFQVIKYEIDTILKKISKED